MITTRDELSAALTSAAELEHSLLLEYLFAAFTLKNANDEDITWAQAECCRQWERRILKIARDEMAHLGTVCNMLSAIGEAPQFRRPNFPQRQSVWNPFDFELAPFSDVTLHRFMRAEQPKGARPKPPYRRGGGRGFASAMQRRSPLFYKFTGELYAAIAQGFASIDGLFIGSKVNQDASSWSNNLTIPAIIDRATAKRAIATILHQGEGSPKHREGSHYDEFEDMREELAREGYFAAARPVAHNPRAHYDLPDAPPGTPITNRFTRQVAFLFNETYETMLLMLMQYYSYGGETDAQRTALQEAIRTSMSMLIRPIAEVLTRLPIGRTASGLCAGPSFELAFDLRLAPERGARWTMLDERFKRSSARAAELAAHEPRHAGRLAYVGENMALLRQNIARAAA
jgi:Ferritin-like